MRPVSVPIVICMVMGALIAVSAHADAPQTGTVEGVVTDPSGTPLPGVTVTLQSERGAKTVATGAEGEYRFGLLVPGGYTVQAAMEGMRSQPAAAPLEAGTRLQRNLQLAAITEETITVISEAPLVDKYEVGAASTLEAEVAENLSFGKRNYQSAVMLLPGVTSDARSQALGDHTPTVNGGLWSETAGFVDGVDTSFNRRGGSSRLFLPTTALASVRLESAGAPAEYGRVIGGVTNAVVKTGTNKFHGDLLYLLQRQSWRAQSDAVPLPRSSDDTSSYELAIGGPIVRDKAWFFVAAAETNSNEIDAFRGGAVLDNSLRGEPLVGKFNFQPTQDHQFSLLYADGSVSKVTWAANAADLWTPGAFDLTEILTQGAWNWALSSNAFLEVKVADYESEIVRNQLNQRPIDPNANPDSPAGSGGAFWDLANGLKYNSVYLGAGTGYNAFPRQQGNIALSLFRGDHEFKFGVDYQDIEFESFNTPPTRYQGRGYDENLPGGFMVPVRKRVFIPPDAPVASTSDNLAIFAQDRITAGDNWTFNVGLRLDAQDHANDVGEEATSPSDMAPRLAAIYDIGGNGRTLLKGTLGRTYQLIGTHIVNGFMSRLPNGANAFHQYAYNRGTQLYDRLQFTAIPSNRTPIQPFDAYYKDEITFAVERQIGDLWAFKARAIFWVLGDMYWGNEQFDENGIPFNAIRNYDEGKREYQGLQFEFNRRYRGNWTLRSNYTLSKAEGNAAGNITNNDTTDADTFLEGRGGVDVVTGRTDSTAVNRFGPTSSDRTHNLNVMALKHWELGRHRLSIGLTGWFRSGRPWTRVGRATVAHPVSGQRILTETYRAPRGSNELEDTMNVHLTASWDFPLGGRVEGQLRAELANATDEQEQIIVNPFNARPFPGRVSYQVPREFRVVVGIRF